MRSWQGHNAGDWRSDQEIGAFGFWDFKVPKAFRPQLFTRYPLTDQDSIYNIWNYTIADRFIFYPIALKCD